MRERIKKANAKLEDVRLGSFLKSVGQETIALYEGRLSSSDMKRYELEDRMQELEESLKKRTAHINRSSPDDNADGVFKIDNEMLRDQACNTGRGGPTRRLSRQCGECNARSG